MSRIAPSRIAPFDPFWMLKKKKKKKKKKRSFAARRMAAALAAHAAVVQGPSGREAGAFSTSQRARARGQPKEQSGVALRRSAQAALEASSRPVEASRGPFGPLTPTRARTDNLLIKTETRSPLDHVAAGSAGRPTGGIYHQPDWCRSCKLALSLRLRGGGSDAGSDEDESKQSHDARPGAAAGAAAAGVA